MPSIWKNYPISSAMSDTIDCHTAGLGVIGIGGGVLGPGADLPAITGSWVVMTVAPADQAGHNMDKQTARKICMAVCTGAGAFIGGSKIAATAAGWIGALFTGGASLIASAAGNAALNAAFTRSYGRSCARYFAQIEEIHDTDMLVRILITLIGSEMGIDMGESEFVY